MLKLNRKCYNK